MPKKLKMSGAAQAAKSIADVKLAKNIMDSTQSIWLAGLGAFSKAQAEGGKVFELLVEQGKKIEERTRKVADKAMETVKGTAEATMSGAVSKAAGQWDKLEQVFEERVSRSLNRLGVLTSKDIEALTKQVADLSDAVRKLTQEDGKPVAKAARSAAKRSAGSAAKRAARPKTAVEKVALAASSVAERVGKQPVVKRARKLVKSVTGSV
jgi:poly(hydroxyalkanoate) granule-associated protein